MTIMTIPNDIGLRRPIAVPKAAADYIRQLKINGRKPGLFSIPK